MAKIAYKAAAIVLFVALFPFSVSGVDSQIGAQCTGEAQEMVPINGGSFFQTFSTSYNRITKVGFYMGGMVSGSFNFYLQNGSGANIIGGMVNVTTEGWYELPFPAEGVEVTPNIDYRVAVSGGQMGSTVGYNQSPSCYSGGQAYIGSPYGSGDWLFKVYGYTYTTPSNQEEDNIINETATPPQGHEANTTTTTATSATIKAPTGLIQTAISDGKGIKVSWTKSSTSDIDGYHLYRSEEKTKGFVRVGQTDKKTLEYPDNGLTAGKTYYYYIRAYKGSLESANSAVLTAIVPEVQAVVGTAPEIMTEKPVADISQSAKTEEPKKPVWLYVTSGGIFLGLLALAFWKIVLPKIKAKRSAK